MYYFLHIERAADQQSDGETYAYVYDDLDGVTASAKRGLKRLPETGQLTLNLIETEGLGPNGGDKRTVTEFTGDADIVATVLKKKLATEKKAQSTQPDLAWSASSGEGNLAAGGE
jgi:hypothetical protein